MKFVGIFSYTHLNLNIWSETVHSFVQVHIAFIPYYSQLQAKLRGLQLLWDILLTVEAGRMALKYVGFQVRIVMQTGFDPHDVITGHG
jgi:hypothetical protein